MTVRTASPQALRTTGGLMTMLLVVAGVMLFREGPHLDNVLDGWRLFSMAFFSGALIGFLAIVQLLGVKPELSFAPTARLPWLAALATGLTVTVCASWYNRTFTGPIDRTLTAELDAVEEGKGSRWHLIARLPDGPAQRYLVDERSAIALKGRKTVRMNIARGALGFDTIVAFEPDDTAPRAAQPN